MERGNRGTWDYLEQIIYKACMSRYWWTEWCLWFRPIWSGKGVCHHWSGRCTI